MTLVQPLFRQQNWLAYSESELQAAQAELQFKIAEQDLIVRVAQAYFDVLIAQDSVGLVEAQKTAISEQLEQAKRNFEVGSATITDTLEAQARYDLTGAQEIAAQNDLEIKRSALQQLINAMPGELSPLGKEFKLESPQPADMGKWVDSAQLSNLQLAIAQANDQIAEQGSGAQSRRTLSDRGPGGQLLHRPIAAPAVLAATWHCQFQHQQEHRRAAEHAAVRGRMW